MFTTARILFFILILSMQATGNLVWCDFILPCPEGTNSCCGSFCCQYPPGAACCESKCFPIGYTCCGSSVCSQNQFCNDSICYDRPVLETTQLFTTQTVQSTTIISITSNPITSLNTKATETTNVAGSNHLTQVKTNSAVKQTKFFYATG